MLRAIKIFLLYIQYGFENRARSFIYFLMALLNPLIYISFWEGARTDSGQIGLTGWYGNEIISYYYLLMILGMFLMPYIETYVGPILIKEGQISRFLLKPYSFYWQMFWFEISFRIIQGVFAIISVFFLYFLTGKGIAFGVEGHALFLAFSIAFMGMFIAFTCKMIVGILAFFITDIGGLIDFVNILVLLCAGFILPISFLPQMAQTVINMTPFPYMIYYPTIAFQGLLSISELWYVLFIQFGILVASSFMYVFLWHSGIKKFTAIGN